MIAIVALVGGFVAGFVVSYLFFRKNTVLKGKAEDLTSSVSKKL